MLDDHTDVRAEDFEARLGRALRTAVAVESPPGHQRRVANRQLLQVAAAPGASPRDHDAVQHEAIAALAEHGQRIGLAGLPIEQPDHRPPPVGRAQLQALLAGAELDLDGLDVDAAVADLDDGVARLLGSPPLERLADRVERAVLADGIGHRPRSAGRAARSYSPPPMSALNP